MKLLVHSFGMGDVDDPEIYAAGPLWEWQNTEQGKWIMENSITQPVFNIVTDVHTYGYRVNISADLSEEDHVFYKLKWG